MTYSPVWVAVFGFDAGWISLMNASERQQLANTLIGYMSIDGLDDRKTNEFVSVFDSSCRPS